MQGVSSLTRLSPWRADPPRPVLGAEHSLKRTHGRRRRVGMIPPEQAGLLALLVGHRCGDVGGVAGTSGIDRRGRGVVRRGGLRPPEPQVLPAERSLRRPGPRRRRAPDPRAAGPEGPRRLRQGGLPHCPRRRALRHGRVPEPRPQRGGADEPGAGLHRQGAGTRREAQARHEVSLPLLRRRQALP